MSTQKPSPRQSQLTAMKNRLESMREDNFQKLITQSRAPGSTLSEAMLSAAWVQGYVMIAPLYDMMVDLISLLEAEKKPSRGGKGKKK